ncbi:hypothetical protein M409DRAFT_69529 [Zasmidium cellare ATCC 36951]|uniref:Impact N-terminal domain-containing protein n=1 Tax=Zasmidium cellare ATCC 36951 TaxID=1080233 RepID=A0A6A6C3W5_ZASCE|nr:uncharacterized protein M409DRAFT_69529 [Zasmidium cellare ATCC 36951]KAF2161715.1 hypothetical protein M409DRAFT_69529 [Zasmidium cellare ATCC 36951]
MSLKRKHDEQREDDGKEEHNNVFRSSPIEDRASTFIGYFSPTLKPKDLQNLAEFQSASHKIVAWRRESNQQSINKSKQYVTGCDDDGEKFAGKKVEKVLEYSNVEGACLVARWYGGVLLGPVRFTHIETCAKNAISAWKEHEQESRMKKRRLAEDEAMRTRLCKTLVERDQSITVLRELAASKELMAKKAKDGLEKETLPSSDPPKPGANPTIDYTAMPLDRLKALEKARDATLGFLLKRIDKAEAELSVEQKPAEEPP